MPRFFRPSASTVQKIKILPEPKAIEQYDPIDLAELEEVNRQLKVFEDLGEIFSPDSEKYPLLNQNIRATINQREDLIKRMAASGNDENYLRKKLTL